MKKKHPKRKGGINEVTDVSAVIERALELSGLDMYNLAVASEIRYYTLLRWRKGNTWPRLDQWERFKRNLVERGWFEHVELVSSAA